MAPTMTLRFVEERETKNTVRFAEVPRDPAKPEELVVGTLYVQKSAINEVTHGVRMASPLEVDLTVEFRKAG